MANLVQLFLDKDSGRLVAKGGSGSGLPPGLFKILGFVFRQPTPILSWTIVHNGGTMDVSVDIYDATGERIIPDQAIVINQNTIQVDFATPQNGQANLVLFVE